MMKDIREYCERCTRCMLSKDGKAIHTTIGSAVAKRPLEIVAIDFTVLEPGTNNVENVLVVTDIFTKFTQAFVTKDQTAVTVARVLFTEWFLKYGIPERIHSDQGRSFEGKIVNALCRLYGIQHSPLPSTGKRKL